MAFIKCIILTLFFFHRAISYNGPSPPEVIADHGYPTETHSITTEDGYILTAFRVPYGLNGNGTNPGPPVLLVHGFGVSCAEFIYLDPGSGLTYVLADAGYDVWLINTRGTEYSRNHTTYDVNVEPEKYFNFTWDEIGRYDIASTIDHILEVNGDESVYYVGHSQGTTVFLVLASTRPEYNKKIRVASLMAPAGIIKHYPNMYTQEICKYVDLVWSILQRYKIYEIPNRENTTSSYKSNSGLKQYMHYGQLVRDGGFRKWNYGIERNLEVYGTEMPPDYDLTKITAPVAFYYAQNDHLITMEDENTLVDMVPATVINYLVPDESFGHSSFASDPDVVDLVYNKLISIMEDY